MRSRDGSPSTGGAARLLMSIAAASLLLTACGVPIPPDAITATAVAEQGAAEDASPSGGGVFDTALSLRASSLGPAGSQIQAAEPPATLALPSATPSPTPAVEEATETPAPPAAESTLDAGTTTATPATSETATETPTTTPTPSPTPTPRPSIEAVNQGFAQEFLGLLNAQRTGRGLSALNMNGILTTGATQYAGFMGTAGFFGHEAPDGSTSPARAARTGYTGAWNGEALSAGQPTPQTALNALLASPPHAAILLDPASVEVGVGYAYVLGSRYVHYWVVVTGIP